MNDFIITQFSGALLSKDPKGRKISFNHRPCSCFIITYKGRVKFTTKDTIIVSDCEHSVFLPQGISYVNECEEDAESYVINFRTQSEYLEPLSLNGMDKAEIDTIFNSVKREADRQILVNNSVGVLAEIYLLAKKLFFENISQNNIHPVVKNAIIFMKENYSNPNIVIKDVAINCCVSEIYLRKLFEKYVSITPFKMFTKIRMEQAKFMIEEKRPINEIALSVGYSDIYQFSRAYKKFYGCSPSITKNTYTS